MALFRSKHTIQAVQYKGEPIPDVTCEGGLEARLTNNCDQMRAHLPHVHTSATGGITCIRVGDWIYPQSGGPFAVAADAYFRANWEVPEEEAAVSQDPASEPLAMDSASEPLAISEEQESSADTESQQHDEYEDTASKA